MYGSRVEACQDCACSVGDVGDLVIFSDEAPDSFEIIEPHQRRELDLTFYFAPYEIDGVETWNSTRLDAWDHLPADDIFVCGGVFRSRPPSPHTTNHLMNFLFLIPVWGPTIHM
jgi:hypothetical protein